MPLKPPPHPQPVKAGLERLGVYFTPWAATILVCAVVLYANKTGDVPEPRTHVPVAEALPPERWTIDVPPHVLATVLNAAIPDKPLPGQRTSGQCNPKAAQVEIRGGCWVKTDTKPPCPEGYQWEHKEACWLPVLRAARPPTTGEPRPGNVAGEAQ